MEGARKRVRMRGGAQRGDEGGRGRGERGIRGGPGRGRGGNRGVDSLHEVILPSVPVKI